MGKEEFVKNLKIARTKQYKRDKYEKSLTQTETAEFLGITQSTLSKYEKGKQEPDIETLCKLIELYECDANWLLGVGSKKDYR